MSANIKSKKLHRRHEEYIGDAYLIYRVKFLLTNKFPQTSMKMIAHGCDVSNRSLGKFGKQSGLGSANSIEIAIGNHCLSNDLESANKIIDKYVEFILQQPNIIKIFNASFEPIVVYNIFHLNKNQTKNFKFKELDYEN